MRLNMAQWSDGETTTNRRRTGGEGSARCCPHHRGRPTTRRPGGVTSRLGVGNFGANRCHLGRRSGNCPTTPAGLSRVGTAKGDAGPLGWAAQGTPERRARSGVPGPMGRTGQGGGAASPLPDPGGAGATLGPTGGRLGGLAAVGPAWVAQGGPGHAPPQERSRGARSVEKNSPKCWLPR
jgi:hypothetical protein